MATQQKDCIFQFKTIDLLKEQVIGIGSYGQVCKAKCDNLICAAKILHQNIFDPKAQHKTAHKRARIGPIRKFEQEIEILRTVKHPNIVQYLGIHQDLVTGVPVLLMELMDENLTTFLAGSAQIPFHTQVNICHDVTQALAFLHSNSIIHRDLSSNNVLLIGDARAKLSDFGMAKLTDYMNGFSTSCALTKNPGSDAYMPPEAVQSPTVYTEKLDCFSFGVLIIQILTQKPPNPRDPYEEITTTCITKCDQSFQRISEIRRRENHINEVSSRHPLLSIALDCLKDVDIERPSTAQLCVSVRALKDGTTYKESARQRSHHQQQTEILHNQKESDLLEEKADHLLVPELQSEILELKQQLMKAKDQARKYDQKLVAKDQELKLVKQQKEASEQARLELEKRLQELKIRTQHLEGPMSLRLIWREGHKLPREISKGCDPVVRDNMVYFKPASNIEIYAYDTIKYQWLQLPNCKNSARCCSLAVIKNQLTTIGGCQHPDDYSNELFSLTEEAHSHEKCTISWTREFPPMKIRRCNTTTLCTEEFLIVAGGVTTDRKVLKTVEVMNLDTQAWSTAADIPIPLYSASLVVNEDRLYMVGGSDKDGDPIQTVFRCSLINLLPQVHGKQQSKRGLKKVWKTRKIADIPVTDTTCVLVQGRLLTIGGISWNGRTTDAVYAYDPFKSRWITVSRMSLPRSECFVAYLPEKNEVLVAGGYTEKSFAVCNLTDHVEVAIAIT